MHTYSLVPFWVHSAVNMTSQRKTLENNSRKLRRLLRKRRSQLDWRGENAINLPQMAPLFLWFMIMRWKHKDLPNSVILKIMKPGTELRENSKSLQLHLRTRQKDTPKSH
ncbi:uncharacterized protein LJ206_009620 isoform 1-T1 [Theristicus caerulescens]